MRRLLFSAMFLGCFLWISPLFSAMTGGDYEIYGDVFSSFQDVGSSGGGFQLYHTGGEFVSGFGAEVATGSIRIAGTLQLGETIKIGDGTSTTTFEIGNNGGTNNGVLQGANILVDIGGGCDLQQDCMAARLAEAVNAGTHNLLVDAGVDDSTSTTVDLVNVNPNATGDFPIIETVVDADVVFVGMSLTITEGIILKSGFQALERDNLSLTLSSSTLSFGTLSTEAISTTSLTMTVTTDSETGYGITLTEDTDFCTGGVDCDEDENNIDDVAAGQIVTAGTEGYGVRTTSGAGIVGADTAIDGSLPLATHPIAISGHETDVEFLVAIDESKTVAGEYAHNLTFTVTANP